jgi:hypothetical protein
MSDATSEAAESPKPKSVPPAADHGHEHDHGHDGHGHDEHDPIHLANPHLAHHFDTPQQQFDAGKLGSWGRASRRRGRCATRSSGSTRF